MQEEKLHHLLREIFGFDEFRNGQKDIIMSILNHGDTIAVMPTGAGKSLCYQLPALHLGGVCLVISPLIALMQDQVRALKEKNIASACLHSGLSSIEKDEIMDRVSRAESFILFISPERLVQLHFLEFLKKLHVNLIVVDEAHCIVEWGAHFRPDYQKLHLIKANFKARILALTASATPQVREEIIEHLKLQRPQQKCFGFFRPTLFYQTQKCFDQESKFEVIMDAVAKIKEGRILIYCATRVQCVSLARRLCERNQKAEFYHAGLSAERRTQIQSQMNGGEIKILCCTCAFGMGIDYPDIRLVVHFEVTSSLEELYQEMGRAGRDQKSAHALTLYSDLDLQVKLTRIDGQSLSSRELKRKLKALKNLENYLRAEACRHRMISEYFGDVQSFKKLRSCGACDFCCPSKEINSSRQIFDLRLRNRLRKLPSYRSMF